MDDSSSNNNSTDEGLSLQDSISRFTVICQGCSQKMIFNKSVLYAVKYPDRPGGTILVESPERLAQRPEVQAATRSTKALLDAYKLNKGSSLPTVKTLSQSTRLSKNIPNLKRHDSSQVFSQSVRKFNKVHTKTLASPFRLAPAASNIGLSFSSTVSFRLKSAAAAAVAATASSASTASYEDSGRNSSAFEFPEEPLSMEAMLSLLDENSLSCSQPVLHPLCNRCAETRSLAIDSEIRHLQEEITRYKKVFTAPLSPLPPAADEEFSWLSCPLQEDEDKLDSELAQVQIPTTIKQLIIIIIIYYIYIYVCVCCF